MASRAPTPSARDEREFWNTLKIAGDEVEHYTSLGEIRDASDLVLRGHLSDFRLSRILQGDAKEDVVTYAVTDVVVTDALRGEPGSRVVPVEFLLNEGPARAAEVIAQQRARVPSGDVVVFLRHKGGPEAGRYRLVNSSGLIASTADGVAAPLASDAARAQSSDGAAVRAPEAAAYVEAIERAGRPAQIDRTAGAQQRPLRSAIAPDRADAESLPWYAKDLSSMKSVDELARALRR